MYGSDSIKLFLFLKNGGKEGMTELQLQDQFTKAFCVFKGRRKRRHDRMKMTGLIH
jgi:hypothetical protein